MKRKLLTATIFVIVILTWNYFDAYQCDFDKAKITIQYAAQMTVLLAYTLYLCLKRTE